jgi:hypothetical protein
VCACVFISVFVALYLRSGLATKCHVPQGTSLALRICSDIKKGEAVPVLK